MRAVNSDFILPSNSIRFTFKNAARWKLTSMVSGSEKIGIEPERKGENHGCAGWCVLGSEEVRVGIRAGILPWADAIGIAGAGAK